MFGLTAVFDWDAFPVYRKHLATSYGRNAAISAPPPGDRWSIQRVYNVIQADIECVAGGKRWLEKSPKNCAVLYLLVRYSPTSVLIHISREATANVASLVDTGRKHDIFQTTIWWEAIKQLHPCSNAVVMAVPLSRNGDGGFNVPRQQRLYLLDGLCLGQFVERMREIPAFVNDVVASTMLLDLVPA